MKETNRIEFKVKLNDSLEKQKNNNSESEIKETNKVIYTSLWPYLLIIILILLFFEWFLAIKRGSNL